MKIKRKPVMAAGGSYWRVIKVFDTDDGSPSELEGIAIEEVFDRAMPYDKEYYRGRKYFTERFFDDESEARAYKAKFDQYVGVHISDMVADQLYELQHGEVDASSVMASSDTSVEIIDAADKILSGAERYGVVLEEFNCDPDSQEIIFHATCLGKPINWYNINSFSNGSVMVSKDYEGSNVTLNSWDEAARYCISDFRNYTKWLPSSSSRTSGKAVTASRRRITASAGSDPYSLIKEHKDAFIDGWASEYEGEPETSWDNIFNNVLEEFRTYCGDEASDFIIDEYNEGRYTEGDMMSAFEQFIMFLDIPAYDE